MFLSHELVKLKLSHYPRVLHTPPNTFHLLSSNTLFISMRMIRPKTSWWSVRKYQYCSSGDHTRRRPTAF